VPIVDENRLKGNQAAHAVAYWLSKQCLVRQPVPVYAFLVSDDQLQNLNTVYVASFARKMLKCEVPVTGQGTKTLENDLVYYTSGDLLNLDTFVDTSVKVDHMLMQISRGVSAPWPQLATTYVQLNVKGFRAPYADRVAEQVRRSASATMRDILDLPQMTAQDRRRLAVLAEVVRPFTQGINANGYWQQHYEDYVAMGRWLKLMGDTRAGETYLRRAIEIIRGDDIFKAEYPVWEDIICEIQGLLDQG